MKIEWSAGFLPKQGSAAGIGYQEEKAACVRTTDMGGGTYKSV